jgi:hypothetical protein
MAELPTWQVDPCPEWCASAHHEDDHPDDRVHRSEGIAVPAVIRSRRLTATRVVFDEEATVLEVGISRVDGSNDTWLYLGAGPGRELEVSAGTAMRLLEVASSHVERAGG